MKKKTKATKSITVKCKDNDVVLKLLEKDSDIDEVWVQVYGESCWTVIGYNDLKRAIAKAEKKFNA